MPDLTATDYEHILTGKFPKGKPADPTKNMSPEDKAKWEEMNEEHRDKFKTAYGKDSPRELLVDMQKALNALGRRPTSKSELMTIQTLGVDVQMHWASTRAQKTESNRIVNEAIALTKTASTSEEPTMPTTDLFASYRDLDASDETDTDAKFEKGKPADPTKNMSLEDKAKWEKAKEENRDKFKSAASDVINMTVGIGGQQGDFSVHTRSITLNFKTRGERDALKQIGVKMADVAGRAFMLQNAGSFGPEMASAEAEMPSPKFVQEVYVNTSLWRLTDVQYNTRTDRWTMTKGKGRMANENQRHRTTWNAREASTDHEAASGLYGYTRKTQIDVEASVRKLQRRANTIARSIWKRDERVASFLTSHAKRAKSGPARLLLSALKGMGPKIASQTRLALDSDQEVLYDALMLIAENDGAAYKTNDARKAVENAYEVYRRSQVGNLRVDFRAVKKVLEKDLAKAWTKSRKTARAGSYIEAEDAFKKITRLLRGEKGPATRAFLKALDVGPDELLGREYFSVEIKKGDMEIEIAGDPDAAMDNRIVQQVHKLWLQFLDYKATAALTHRGGIEIPVNWPDSGVTVVGKDKGKYFAVLQGLKTTYRSRERFTYAMKNEAQLPSRMVEKLLVQIDSGKRGSDKTATREFGLYGYRTRTANLGLTACAQIREAAGHISYDLHSRRQAKYTLITGYLKEHSKAGKCRYSRLLLSSYPDAPPPPAVKVAAEGTPDKTASMPEGVEEWLAWE